MSEKPELLRQAEEYMQQREKRDHLRDELKVAQKYLDELEQELAEQFGIHGVQSINLRKKILYRAIEFHARIKPESREEALHRFRVNDLEHLLSVQPGKLTSWVREQLEQDEGSGCIPPEFEDLIECYDRPRVRIRAS